MFNDAEKLHIISAKHTLQTYLTDFKTLLEQIYDTPGIVTNSLYVSGGVIPSILQGEAIHDIDIYSTDFTVMEGLVYQFETRFPDHIMDVDDKYSQHVGKIGKMITSNAVTLNLAPEVQLITKMCGPTNVVVQTFDFVHCSAYYSLLDEKLYISRNQYECIVKKQLKVLNYSNLTEKREQKFYNRNYQYATDVSN